MSNNVEEEVIAAAGRGTVHREDGPSTTMTHMPIQEALDGSPVEWMEHVSDEQYGV
jgi:hypothetical protein